MVGAIPERGFLTLHMETVITQEETYLYHISHESLLQLENIDQRKATTLYSWVKKNRLRYNNYMAERVVLSKTFIKGN